jgi:hypothetical protein
MDLIQRKLNRDEWNGIEIPINDKEKRILSLITEGFHNVHIKNNNNISIIDFLKVSVSNEMMEYIYITHLSIKLIPICRKYREIIPIILNSKIKLKKQDLIRIKNTEKNLSTHNNIDIFEFKLLELLNDMLYNLNKNTKWIISYYTIKIILNYNIQNINTILHLFITSILDKYAGRISKRDLIQNGYEMIERNHNLIKYSDDELYDHQKQLFTICKRQNPKLVLYIAPTGTGKTLSPLGLSEQYKIIFVCAARHVGLALAKNAISINKKIAFAFGCNSTEDIRLHYFSAIEYTTDRRTGGIRKVDNTIGDNVQIIISDIKSYIPAMLYMLAFNPAENIILYWDEPTITLDYDNHELHETIQNNWTQNLIPNIVLSSATLPFEDEIQETINSFKDKFNDIKTEIHSIVSYDCKKTIPIINKEGFIELPHYMYKDYNDLKDCVIHCEKFKTILRYLDLNEIIRFIIYINDNNLLENSNDVIEHERNFPTIESVNMQNIKLYYLKLLKRIHKDKWNEIYAYFVQNRIKKYESTINITTNDAHTLTHGPTIYLVEDTSKIASFCIQTAQIPEDIIQYISDAISHNNILNSRINSLEQELEDGTTKDDEKDKKDKKNTNERMSPEMKRLKTKIEDMRRLVRKVALNEMFVPNTNLHLGRFNAYCTHAFTCDISDQIIEKIMLINGIEDSWKLLLMMGIGVFANIDNPTYTEIMRNLAQEQKLYIIIASSDYIYGTNYQFCHGYIGKDLNNMSQEKCIQAMGRIGRNNIQNTYSIRFRDNLLIYKLFKNIENKPEVLNMNRLFNIL